MICSNCGNTIKDESKFCQYCGTAVSAAAQTADTQQPAAEAAAVYTPPAVEGQPADAENAAAAAYTVVEESQPQTSAYQPPVPPYYTGKPQASTPVPPYSTGASQNQQPVPPYAASPAQDTSRKGFAIASLILSLVGVLFAFSCCLAFVGTLCCILGVIFGAVAMKNPANKALAVSGLVIGIVGFVLSIVIGIIFVADIGTAGDLFEDFYYNYDYWTY